jgi:hypothetical protein
MAPWLRVKWVKWGCGGGGGGELCTRAWALIWIGRLLGNYGSRGSIGIDPSSPPEAFATINRSKQQLRQGRRNAIDKGTGNEEDDMSTLEVIIDAMPAEYREPLGAKSSAKDLWEAIAAMCVGFDHAKKTMAQLLKQAYANLKFKDGESMEEFSLCLQTLISKLSSHGITIDEEKAVSKYLHSMPAKYIQIALSIEIMLNLSTLTIEDVTGRLLKGPNMARGG